MDQFVHLMLSHIALISLSIDGRDKANAPSVFILSEDAPKITEDTWKSNMT